jgi:uracil phosphoribosyltransferase
MLATGSSMELAYKALLTKGKPAKVHIASVLATRFAVDYLLKQMPDDNIILWTAAIDPDLNEHSYIVPGLGDAGDLAFGEKL